MTWTRDVCIYIYVIIWTPPPMIHRLPENTVNTNKNKHFRMIGFWTPHNFGCNCILSIQIPYLISFKLNTSTVLTLGFQSDSCLFRFLIIYVKSTRQSSNLGFLVLYPILVQENYLLNLFKFNIRILDSWISGFYLDSG